MTRPTEQRPSTPMKRAGRRSMLFGAQHFALRLAVCLMAAAALVLTGCSAIPSSGQVQQIDGLSDNPFDNDLSFEPAGPRPDATPRQIVDGFISAGTGTADNYRTAREFLALGVADSWRPDTRTLVYEGLPNIVEPREPGGPFFVNLDLARTVDENGISRPVPAGGGDIIEFHLEQQPNGEWRISEAPDGIILSENNFSAVFDAHNLYFYDPTYEYAVPDVRWFARRASVPASLMRVLLDGPAPYLQGAAVSAFVDGTTLVSPTVAIDSGEASVDLSVGSVESISELQELRMQKQAELVLIGSLNTISSVQLTVNQVPLNVMEGAETVAPIQNKQVPAAQVAVEADELVSFAGVQAQPIANVPAIAKYSPQTPAMSVDEDAAADSARRYAFLNAERNHLYTVDPGDEDATLVLSDGERLSEPSFDVHGWLWTAEGGGEAQGTIYAAPAGSPDEVKVAAQWLRGRAVTELRVSRDGARALIVTHRDGESNVMVTGVIRSAEGIPTELTEPLFLAPSVPADQGAWVDDTTVVVMKGSSDDPVQAEILNFDADPARIAGLEGMTHLSAGNGLQEIYGQTAVGVYLRVGNSWTLQTEGVRDPSFAG